MQNQIVQPSDVARMLREKTLPDEWDIWEGEGEFTASNSRPLAANPYLPGTLAWYAWTRGWKSASVGIRIGNAFGAVFKFFIVAALILVIVFWIIPYSSKSWFFPLLLVGAAVWYVASRRRKHKVKTPKEKRAILVEWLGEMCDAHEKGGRDYRGTIRRQIDDIQSDYDTFKEEFPELEVRLKRARAVLQLPPKL